MKLKDLEILPKIGRTYDGSLDKFTECMHKTEGVLAECIHCDFAWCLARIKFLEKTLQDCGEVEIEVDVGELKESIKSYFENLCSDYFVKVYKEGSVEIDGWFSTPQLAQAISKALPTILRKKNDR